MASLPTISIHSWKDATQEWIINSSDFDPDKHTKWGEGKAVSAIIETAARHRQHTPHMSPSVPDFVTDDNLTIIAVNIIDPEKGTSRKEIPIDEYDADKHSLWSSHTRFGG
jgi:hypothetical protein